MKTQNIGLLTTIALAASIAAGASTASAAGLLGQRYVSATLDYVFWDSDSGLDDGLGATISYNQPLARSLDLSLSYSYLSSDLEFTSTSINAHDVAFGGTWFTPAGSGKFFTAAQLGWSRATSSGISDSTAYWLLGAGYEFPIGGGSSATPFITYADAFESGYSGSLTYGIMGEFDLTDTTSLLLSVQGNDDSDFGVSGGVIFRF